MQNKQDFRATPKAAHGLAVLTSLPDMRVSAFMQMMETRNPQLARRLRSVTRGQDELTQSLPGLVVYMQDMVRHYWLDVAQHEDNPYINKQLGEARDLYVSMLRQRYEGARLLLEDVLRAAQGADQADAAGQAQPDAAARERRDPGSSKNLDDMSFFFPTLRMGAKN